MPTASPHPDRSGCRCGTQAGCWSFAFVLFSLGIIGTGLLAIPILAASGAYAVKEFFGVRGGLADKARYRPFFYGVLAFGCSVDWL